MKGNLYKLKIVGS